jgi:uncharacterized damage-inducible protein DinB
MNLQDLKTLIDFNYWARDQMLAELEPLTPEQFTRSLGGSFGSIRDTVAHIHAAEWAWCQRWHGTSPKALPPADRFPDLASVKTAWSDLEQQVRTFINGLDDAAVNRVFEYKTISSGAGRSALWEMVYHVVNHATYHRGQVSTLVRQVGATPRPTDAVIFFRARQLA